MHSNFLDGFEKIDFTVRGVRLPKIIVPKHYYEELGINSESSNEEFLRLLCRKGLQEKGLYSKKEYIQRIKHEFNLITEIGFTDYFLLIWDVINFCREKGIPVGKGRGSAAASLILYAIGVTGVDPVENKLFFERFISRARAKSTVVDGIRYIDGSLAPDVDLDFCTDRRSEAVDYLKSKYDGKFCKLPTISTLATRQVVKDVSKIFERLSEDEVNVITKSIPLKFGQPMSIEESIKESEVFGEFAKNNPDIIECALVLEDMYRQKGTHASAYLVGHDDFNGYLPCELDGNGEVVCSYDMNYSQKETIKLDLLGLHGVTLIDRISKSLNTNFDDFDPNDPKIYELSQVGDLPYGLFQIGADANYRVFRKVKPKNWGELSDVISLARPGAMSFVDDYIANEYKDYWGNEKLREILSATHNIPIYQEQVIQIANQVFGFSLEEGENVRRCVAKKKAHEVAAWIEKIYARQQEMGLPKEIADFFCSVLEMNANYGFAKAHACPYSNLSALTLYLKYNHPQHFYIECLRMADNKADSQDHISRIHQELSFFGIELLPPDFIKSKEGFTIEGKNIRYGFSSIKGVSDKSINSLKNFLVAEKTTKFDIFNAAENCKLNVGVLSALIQAGMMSEISKDREMLVFESQLWKCLTEKEKTFCMERGADYDYDLRGMVKNIHSWVNEKGKPVAAKTRLETIKTKTKKYVDIYEQNKAYPEFASWFYEKQLLGYSYTTTLKKVFGAKRDTIMNAYECKQAYGRIEGVFQVVEMKKSVSGKGNKYIRMTLQDESGVLNFMLIGDKYENYVKKEVDPVKGDIVFAVGKTSEDIIFGDSMKIQSHRIFMKLADLK